ncbi:MAG TPA: protoporphyrinogen oxidase [Candidatus Eremiobacteraceae bacterium]|nr:protoporphyrinogen oxidase [Candidatus Eremiobacteraceae bacterium]
MSAPFEDLDVAVIGGGISGLAAAHALRKAGRNVVVLEARAKFGGVVGSVQTQMYLADAGPQSFIAAPALLDLAHELGLESQIIVAAGAGAKRYIYRSGSLIAVPTSPGAFIASPLLSAGAKWRLLAEPFVAPRAHQSDESVASFVERRAGPEVLHAVAGPLVSGIYAGDPSRLSAQSTMPALVDFERTNGSVVRGFLARRSRDGAADSRRPNGAADFSRPRSPISFKGGNASLITALATVLEGRIYAGARATKLRQRGAGFTLECEGLPEGTIEAAHVIIATPADSAADLLEPLEPQAAAALRAIEYAPVAQVAIAYPRAVLGAPHDGFGFLACRGEGVRILGAVWNSNIFAARAPDDELLCTAFLGGATDPAIGELDDEQLARVAHADLSQVMRIAPAKPKIVSGFRWERAIPQYTLGHEERLAVIESAVDRIPGLRLTGNYLRGVSVPDCIRRANEIAAALSS